MGSLIILSAFMLAVTIVLVGYAVKASATSRFLMWCLLLMSAVTTLILLFIISYGVLATMGVWDDRCLTMYFKEERRNIFLNYATQSAGCLTGFLSDAL